MNNEDLDKIKELETQLEKLKNKQNKSIQEQNIPNIEKKAMPKYFDAPVENGTFKEQKIKKNFTSQDIRDFIAISAFYIKYFVKNWLSMILTIFIPIILISSFSHLNDFYINNYIFGWTISPIIFVSLVIIPLSITDFRNSSVIKRMGVLSIPKWKFSAYITISGLIYILSLIFILMFIIAPIFGFMRSLNSENFYYLYGMGYGDIAWFKFLFFLILTSITFIQLGIFFGMKINSKINILVFGFLLSLTFLFLSGMFAGSWQYYYYSYNSGWMGGVSNWIFAITPWTFIMAGLNDTLYGISNWSYYLADFFVAISLISLSLVFSEKIISYEAVR